jgi:hypothetical protein
MTELARCRETKESVMTAKVNNTGEYNIKKGGYHPQAGYAFHYRDEKYDFWFHIQLEERVSPDFDLVIRTASVNRFSGPDPVVAPQDVAVIEDNIRRYFRSVDLFGRPITPANPPHKRIVFAWRFRHDDRC